MLMGVISKESNMWVK